MSLTLHVDGARWRAHLARIASSYDGLVPVAKGNGYGFGLDRLAAEATALGVDTLAVGTYDELARVSGFDGSVLVLTPWRPFLATRGASVGGSAVIHTVSRIEDLVGLLDGHPDGPGQPHTAGDPRARFVLERATTMQRHGLTARGLREAALLLQDRPDARLEGIALHLPLEQGSHLSQVTRLMHDVVASGLDTSTIWASHLTHDELTALRSSYGDFTWRPRIGTGLWLGDRATLRVSATVLDVHPLERGDVFGYRGRTAPKSGHLLVVSGGTAHGIGLEAPTGDQSLRSRAASLARGGMDAVGFVRSPYSIGGKQRLFAEPPHMQASMLFLPGGAPVPEVGDEVDVRVRYTATSFDRVVID